MEFIKPVPYCTYNPSSFHSVPIWLNRIQLSLLILLFNPITIIVYSPSFRFNRDRDTLSIEESRLQPPFRRHWKYKLTFLGRAEVRKGRRGEQKLSLQNSHLIINSQFTFQQIFKTQLRCHQHTTTHRETYEYERGKHAKIALYFATV